RDPRLYLREPRRPGRRLRRDPRPPLAGRPHPVRLRPPRPGGGLGTAGPGVTRGLQGPDGGCRMADGGSGSDPRSPGPPASGIRHPASVIRHPPSAIRHPSAGPGSPPAGAEALQTGPRRRITWASRCLPDRIRTPTPEPMMDARLTPFAFAALTLALATAA